MKNPVLILGPMESESALLIQSLENRRTESAGIYSFNIGEIENYPVVVCRTYIGVVNSAAATALAIQRFSPICVIIQGTSGAHDPELHQGDIVLGERIVEIGGYYTAHRGRGFGANYIDHSFPGAELPSVSADERVKALYSDRRILAAAETVAYMGGRVRKGTIGAADIWNRELDVIDRLHQTLGTDCEEMEGFGIAQVCAGFGIPMADIRIISNSEWHPQEEFNEKFGEDCQMFVLEAVKRLIAEQTLM